MPNFMDEVYDATTRSLRVAEIGTSSLGPSVVRFFSNDTYGADMNVNVAFGASPVGVHNGIDSVLWTGSAISG
ncbi:MAG TPA: hypothetical protein VMW48_14935, partial [Vicinamibacterales bacterium]|nr:hypothetical protein [Vicinamibacterales bacterium]